MPGTALRGYGRAYMARGGKTPAWQRKEGKSEAGGLNRKGIASYRAKNPGSKLKMAVTTKPSKLKKGSKSANRRKSFCARMGGMKKRLTSAKTANDPNSRINKALRKWNCQVQLETAITKLIRFIQSRIEALSMSVTSGGVDNMENYKYIIGQINAYEATKQELSNLLNDKEQNEGTVVDIKTKNTLT